MEDLTVESLSRKGDSKFPLFKASASQREAGGIFGITRDCEQRTYVATLSCSQYAT